MHGVCKLARCAAILIALVVASAGAARGQDPILPGASKAAEAKDAGSDPGQRPQVVPSKDYPHTTVATSPGTIAVEEPISDAALRSTVETLLRKYPGVRKARVEVQGGVV